MTGETISVVFEPISGSEGLAFHETLVYRNADGDIIGIATADHSGTPPDATLSQKIEDLLQSQMAVNRG